MIDDSHRKLVLDGAEVPADRDFELTWTAKGTAPQVGLFHETVQGKDYLLASVTPPSVPATGPVKPRETIFVIDNSGSMDGPSMQQAKDALLQGLDTLKPQDRFNIVRFDDTLTCSSMTRFRPTRSISTRPAPSSRRCRPTAVPKWCRP